MDWLPQFGRDLFVGVFTGLIVGLALFLTQGWAEKRADRKRARSQWETTKTTVRKYFVRPYNMQLHAKQLITEAADAFGDILAAVEDVPIRVLADDADNSELTQFAEFIESVHRLRAAGIDIDATLNEHLAEHISSRRAFVQSETSSYVIRRVVFPDVQPDLTVYQDRDAFEESLVALRQHHPDTLKRVDRFGVVFRDVEARYLALRSSIEPGVY